MDIQKIKGIAFDLIEDNQTNFSCDDSEKNIFIYWHTMTESMHLPET